MLSGDPSAPTGRTPAGSGASSVAHQEGAQLQAEIDRFGERAAAALAGMLNLDRLLGRLACFGAPESGGWCVARVRLDGEDHRATATGPTRSTTSSSRSGPPARPGVSEVDDPAVLLGWGADPTTAQSVLADGPATACTAPLRAHGQQVGEITVVRAAGAAPPTPGEWALLRELAHRAGPPIGAARTYAARNRLAGALRDTLRPGPLPTVPGVRLGAAYRAANVSAEIGGDYYQVYPAGDGSWVIDLGDVCGSGVAAAVLSGQIRQSLRTVAQVESDPVRALGVVHRAMTVTDPTTFVTVLHGRISQWPDGALTVQLAGGGHLPALLMHRDGRVEPIAVGGTIVGMLTTPRFSSATVHLHPGDSLVLHTDGVVEAPSPAGRLGNDRLVELLADSIELPAEVIAARVDQLVVEHVGSGNHDDVAVLVLQVEPAPGSRP